MSIRETISNGPEDIRESFTCGSTYVRPDIGVSVTSKSAAATNVVRRIPPLGASMSRGILDNFHYPVTTFSGNLSASACFDGSNIWYYAGSTYGLRCFPANKYVGYSLSDTTAISGAAAGNLVFDGERVWANASGGGMNAYDVRTKQKIGTTSTAVFPSHRAFDGQYIWASVQADSTVKKYNINTMNQVASVSVGSTPFHVMFDGYRYLWVINAGSNTISKVDVVTNSVAATITPTVYGQGFTGIRGLGFDGRYIWFGGRHNNIWHTANVIDVLNNAVYQVDPGNDNQAVVGNWCFCFDGEYMWAGLQHANYIAKIGKRQYGGGFWQYAFRNATYPLPHTATPRELVYDGTGLWIINASGYSSKIMVRK